MQNLKCKNCEAGEEELLVFVGTFERNGKVEQLEEGMHPYCKPCRSSLGISDELNAGRLKVTTHGVDCVCTTKES